MNLPVTVYTPESPLRNPGRMFAQMFRDVLACRELAWRLFVRDLNAQYRQTFFGYIWAFLPPLVASMTFIFLNSQGIVNIATPVPYPAFAMMGTLLWQVFVDSVQNPAQSVTAAKAMLTKINFPREAVLLGGFYMVFFNFLIRLLLVAGVMIWWKIVPSTTVLMFPVAMAGLFVCGYAIGLAITPLSALYGDVTKGIPIVAQFGMLLTPVVYPARTTGLAGWLATWNPVSPLITTAREALTGQTLSLLPAFGIVFVLALLAVFLGLIVFRLAMPILIERMGG
jgi:lipopolysaccharide transport system permease protein